MKFDVVILDGRHLLWRTSDVFGMLSVEIGDKEIGTGGIYGFLSIALRLHARYGGKIVVAWEGTGNFRYGLYPEYKRKAPPDQDRLELVGDMNEQEVRLKALLRAMGVEQFAGRGCEADDVLGRLAVEYAEQGKSVAIYTGDSDLRQLASPSIVVIAPGRKGVDKVYGVSEVIAHHGVPTPSLMADLKALAGDSSDNIPGVPGIGPVTASKLVSCYGVVEEVIRAAQGAPEKWQGAERFRQAIAERADAIRLFKQLTTIKTDAGMRRIKTKRSQSRVLQHLVAYRFRSLVAPVELNGLMRMG